MAKKKNRQKKYNLENGFSLIELLVAMMLFMIITGVIWGFFRIGSIGKDRASRRADVMKNARAAMHLIGRDALNAGLSFNTNGAIVPDNFVANRLGIPPDVDAQRDVLTGIIAGNNINTNILAPTINDRTDLVAFAFRDMDFTPGACTAPAPVGVLINLRDAAAGPTAATVRLTTDNCQATGARINDLYLVESDTSQIAVMPTAVPAGGTNNKIDFAPGDPLGLNQALNQTGIDKSLLNKCSATVTSDCTTYVASLKRFFWVLYKVKSDGTLVRITYGNNRDGTVAADQIQEMPLAYNIQNMQISYVLENGTVTENPAAGPDGVAGTADDTPSNANFVRQIMISVTVQSVENDEQTGRPESITLNASFSTRNLEYDAG